jgi:tripartite-type tricarboxylate transporter receptor subunit TctC
MRFRSDMTRRALLQRASAVGVALTLPLGVEQAAAQAINTTLVVPFPPGGSTDALARLLQPGLQDRLGRTVIIENKAGAAGSLGAAQVAKAAPDGTTILVTFDSHAVIPAILDKPPVDVEKDLLSVFLVGTAPYVIAANPTRPWKTFADVVAAAKEKPGSVKYASVGVGTIGHLAMTLLAKKSGVEITHVPYRGGGPAINDVVGGHVDLVCGSAALISPQLAGGTLKPIMQMGRQRLPLFGETQTAIEAGFADFEALAWWGVFVPKGTPPAVVETIAASLKAILSEPTTGKRLSESQQMTLTLGGPAALDTFFAKQVEEWGKVVRENGIKAQS